MAHNNLFFFRTNCGFKSFFCDAYNHDAHWINYAGAATVIPAESGSVNLHMNKYDHNIINECSKTKDINTVAHAEPTVIPFQDSDFQPIYQTPQEIDFNVQQNQEHLPLDPLLEVLHRKQRRLATPHERLGHLSYPKVKLLC